jgi:hypothetical protein
MKMHDKLWYGILYTIPRLTLFFQDSQMILVAVSNLAGKSKVP